MDSSKEKILASLEMVMNQEVNNTLLVPASDESAKVHGIPRLLICFNGTSSANFYENGKLKTAEFPSGSWFYCSASGFLIHNKNKAHEGVSLSFYGNYIRAMHIFYDGVTLPPTERDIFYHADHGISEAGQHILHALDELAKSPDYSETAPYYMKALLKTAIVDIKKSSSNPIKFNANNLWMAINTYIRAHRTEQINRETVARYFRLSPGYVSHLFKSFSSTNFSNTLLNLRLEHAALLLKNTQLTIDEICSDSGFNYTSYFIKRFKEVYSMTPYAYRKSVRSKRHGSK